MQYAALHWLHGSDCKTMYSEEMYHLLNTANIAIAVGAQLLNVHWSF
jgi:hypothetical protein